MTKIKGNLNSLCDWRLIYGADTEIISLALIIQFTQDRTCKEEAKEKREEEEEGEKGEEGKEEEGKEEDKREGEENITAANAFK